MSGRDARSRVCARLQAIGYEWVERHGHEDVFVDDVTGHQLVLAPWPRWGGRIDILTLLSSFPLPAGVRATAFHYDLGSQLSADGSSTPGRWRIRDVEEMVEQHVVPYLGQARSPDAILGMLLDGSLRPVSSAAPATVVQHAYYLAKWWRLAERVEQLRALAARIGPDERAKMERAPWGRTEIAEVLWHGSDMPAPPNRPPWGLADQGDPRAEVWYRKSLRAVRDETVAEQQQEHSDRLGAHGRVRRPHGVAP